MLSPNQRCPCCSSQLRQANYPITTTTSWTFSSPLPTNLFEWWNLPLLKRYYPHLNINYDLSQAKKRTKPTPSTSVPTKVSKSTGLPKPSVAENGHVHKLIWSDVSSLKRESLLEWIQKLPDYRLRMMYKEVVNSTIQDYNSIF